MTRTSKDAGFLTMSIAHESTSWWFVSTSGYVGAELVDDRPPEPRGRQHVCLVDAREAVPPPAGELERQLDDAPDLGLRVRQRVAGGSIAGRARRLRSAPRSRGHRSARERSAGRRPRGDRARSGDEATSAGWTVTGRRFANSPSVPRSANSACSGRTVAAGLSHLGPPHAPSRIASPAPAASMSSGRIATPYVSIALPPAAISDQSTPKSNARPAASSTARPAATTSGPTPSPGIVAMA